MKDKFSFFTFGGLWAFITGAPVDVKNVAFLTFILIVCDTVTGVMAALAIKELRSERMRVKLFGKLIHYSVVISLAFVMGSFLGSWLIIKAGFGAVIATEVISMIENLLRIKKATGLNLGPANKFVDVVAAYFDTGQKVSDPEPTK